MMNFIDAFIPRKIKYWGQIGLTLAYFSKIFFLFLGFFIFCER